MDKKINGNTAGIRDSVLDQMLSLYDIRAQQYEFVPYDLIEAMAGFTGSLGREVSVYISRDGRVKDVSIGDASKVSMPDMRLTRSEHGLSGVRCIHTHPNGNACLSGVDLGTLRSMRLDAIAAVGVADAKPTAVYAAFLGDMEGGERSALVYGPMQPYRLPQKALIAEIREADLRLRGDSQEEGGRPERAILVGMYGSGEEALLDELARLADTAGAKVVGRFAQRRRAADNATYIGSGKAEELALKASELNADLFIFDDELNAVQLRNLEQILGCRVIDRTTLILDIFAARAASREGKLQVELAQLKYRLPRLTGQGQALSRLGGGIGTRGPGEKKLEVDRRRLRRRIFELERELSEIEKQRGVRRERREKNKTPAVALVGYTNAGKSTLLNAVSGADALAEDKLFATLDPIVRMVELPNGTQALFCDTVGFINKLPHDLVKAFRSTLDEVRYADVIVHVIDSSADDYRAQADLVEDVLQGLGAGDTPRVNAYNKSDKTNNAPYLKETDALVSALSHSGLDSLLEKVEKVLNSNSFEEEVFVPYDKYEAASFLRAQGGVIFERHEEDGTLIRASMDDATLRRVKNIIGGADMNNKGGTEKH